MSAYSIRKPVVYFARIGNAVKIGHSLEPIRRVRYFGQSCELSALPPKYRGKRCEDLRIMRGGKKEEKHLHRIFANLRIGKTEWFRLQGTLQTMFNDCVPANPSCLCAVTVRLPLALARQLRQFAIIQDRPIEQVMAAALQTYLRIRKTEEAA